MAEQLILHHYPMSPFAEKIRLILGLKMLPWSSVVIPNVMPKPDLTALTGGYRKTPVLQIGADIYCDTALIADVLEQYAPRPTLYPGRAAGASRILAQWADSTLFWTAIPYTMQPAGLPHLFEGAPPEAIKAFGDDRTVFRANMPRMRPAEATAALSLYLHRLEEALGDQLFFFGSAPSIGDFSIYHCLWFLTRGGPVAGILDSHPKLAAWRERMAVFGHGSHEKLDSGSAVAIARDATAEKSTGNVDSHGIALGDRVVIAATDTGVDPIEGTLYGATRDRISIARQDPRAGSLVVHFPRLGFELRRVR
ncbi:MAG TPA: glutathione S-transferase family protein [Steroidobacteraceae bacterium]|jgi:glutathione S-transferase|nr:glutathione S-transferase family protein [Steroidobacteraceae bacterium]